MRAGLLLSIPFLIQATRSEDTSPFHAPRYGALSNRFADLAKRENNCPDGFGSCEFIGFAEACCEPDTICSRDDADNIACCPSGAVCTGTLTGTEEPSSPTKTKTQQPPDTFITTTNEITDTSSDFMFPQPTTAPPSITGSTIPNAPYPFAYIPTTFKDEAQCSKSHSLCESQFSRCTVSLGGAHGVTIDGGNGGGVTVQGVAPTGNAQSICFSLSREACHGLQAGYCTAFGDEGGPGNTDIFPGNSSTKRSSALYEIFVGISVALAGMIA